MPLITAGLQSITSGEVYTFQGGGRWEIVSNLNGGVVTLQQRIISTGDYVTTATIDKSSVEKLFLPNQEYKFIFNAPITVYIAKFAI